MKIAKATLSDIGKLAELNKRLIEDERHPNLMTDKKVRLDVLSHNEEAIVFYKAYGFRVGCLRMEK